MKAATLLWFTSHKKCSNNLLIKPEPQAEKMPRGMKARPGGVGYDTLKLSCLCPGSSAT